MKWKWRKPAFFAAAAIGVVFVTFILAQSRRADAPAGSVTVISGAESARAPAAVPARSGLRYLQSGDRLERTVEPSTAPQTPLRQLHESIAAEDQDKKWAFEVERDVTGIVNQVPYISSAHTLRCGTIRCELSIVMEPGISADNAEYVAGRFYALPDTGQAHQIQVEAVFPTEDRAGVHRGLTVIYMRDAG